MKKISLYMRQNSGLGSDCSITSFFFFFGDLLHGLCVTSKQDPVLGRWLCVAEQASELQAGQLQRAACSRLLGQLNPLICQ